MNETYQESAEDVMLTIDQVENLLEEHCVTPDEFTSSDNLPKIDEDNLFNAQDVLAWLGY